jgi:hypothetical protein
MADQKKRGFGAFEDRVHELHEEDEQQRESAPERETKPGAQRGSPRPSEDPGKPRK